MALTNVTTTLDLNDLLGVAFDVRRTRVTLTTNAPKNTIHDTSTGKSRIGGGSVVLNDAGVATATTWAPGASANPLTWQTTFHVDYLDSATKKREQVSFGPYTITTSGNLTALEEQQVAVPTATAAQSATAAGISATAAATSATSAATSATTAQTAAALAEAARDTATEIALGDAEAAFDGFLDARDLPADATDLTATITTAVPAAAKPFFAPRGDMLMGVAVGLRQGVNSFGIGATGDSTTTPPSAWFRLLANGIASDFPAFHHRYWEWSHTLQGCARPIALTAEGTPRAMVIAAGTSSQRSGGQLEGPNLISDPDLSGQFALPDWSPGETQAILHKWTDDAQRSLILYLTPTGNLRLVWYADGTTTAGDKTSTAVVPFADGARGFVRVVLDLDNGAAGHDVKFYTSTDGATWTQLGTTITTAGVTSVFQGTSRWGWGQRGSNSLSAGAKVYEIQIRDGINGAIILPILPEMWSRTIGAFAPVVEGKPIVDWVMGAYPGGGVNYDYITNLTNGPGYLVFGDRPRLMNPNMGQVAMFFSTSHNEYHLNGPAWASKYQAWISAVTTARMPLAAKIMLTQNPRYGPAAGSASEGHRARRQGMLALARNGTGLDVIDTYQAFLDDGRGAALIGTDGVHPEGIGYQVWHDRVRAELNAALARVSSV